MKLGRIMKNREGVSNVVASIMIMGIMTSIMGMVFTTYVPAIAKSTQYDHQSEVMKNFVELKNHVDVLVVRGDEGVSIASPLTLGGRGGPLMGVGQSSGRAAVYDEVSTGHIYDTAAPTEVFGKERGQVTFASSYDRIADKGFYFEHDAIIVDQEGSAVMKVAPNIYIKKEAGEIHLSYTSITLSSDPKSFSGIKTVNILATLSSTQTIVYYSGGVSGIDDITLRIETDFVDVWYTYFNRLCNRTLDYNAVPALSDYNIYISDAGGWVMVNFKDVNKFTSTSAVVDIEIAD